MSPLSHPFRNDSERTERHSTLFRAHLLTSADARWLATMLGFLVGLVGLAPRLHALIPGTPVLIDGAGHDVVLRTITNASDLYFIGVTSSPDLPVTTGAIYAGDNSATVVGDVVVGRVSLATGQTVWLTTLGGSASDNGNGIDLSADGKLLIGGWTNSADFPVTPGAQQTTLAGASDAFLAELDPATGAVLYASYLGGSAEDQFSDLAYLPNFDAWALVGFTASADIPITRASGSISKSTTAGDVDGLIVVVPNNGTRLPDMLAYHRRFPGVANQEIILGVCAEPGSFGFLITGTTTDTNFWDSGFSPPNQGGKQAFLNRIDRATGARLFSKTVGGSGDDTPHDVAYLFNTGIVIVGTTTSTDYPAIPTDALQPTYGGGASDGFIHFFTGETTSDGYATYFGGEGADAVGGIVADPYTSSPYFHIVGATGSEALPAPNTADPDYLPPGQPDYAGGPSDGFVALLRADTGTSAFTSRFFYSRFTYAGSLGEDGFTTVAVNRAQPPAVGSFAPGLPFAAGTSDHPAPAASSLRVPKSGGQATANIFPVTRKETILIWPFGFEGVGSISGNLAVEEFRFVADSSTLQMRKPVRFTIKIANQGPANATNVVVSFSNPAAAAGSLAFDPLPSGVSAGPIDGPPGVTLSSITIAALGQGTSVEITGSFILEFTNSVELVAKIETSSVQDVLPGDDTFTTSFSYSDLSGGTIGGAAVADPSNGRGGINATGLPPPPTPLSFDVFEQGSGNKIGTVITRPDGTFTGPWINAGETVRLEFPPTTGQWPVVYYLDTQQRTTLQDFTYTEPADGSAPPPLVFYVAQIAPGTTALSGRVITTEGDTPPTCTLYADLNGDAQPDNSEPTTQSAADGYYSFTGLAPGSHTIRLLVPNGYQQVHPASFLTTEAPAGQQICNLNFAIQPALSPLKPDIAVTWTPDDDFFGILALGGTTTVTLNVTNLGTAGAAYVSVNYDLPAFINADQTALTGPTGTRHDPATRTLECPGLGVGQTIRLTLRLTGLAVASTAHLTAITTFPETVDLNPANNTATPVAIAVSDQHADIAVSLELADLTPPPSGSAIGTAATVAADTLHTFQVTITNLGPQNAEGVEILLLSRPDHALRTIPIAVSLGNQPTGSILTQDHLARWTLRIPSLAVGQTVVANGQYTVSHGRLFTLAAGLAQSATPDLNPENDQPLGKAVGSDGRAAVSAFGIIYHDVNRDRVRQPGTEPPVDGSANSVIVRVINDAGEEQSVACSVDGTFSFVVRPGPVSIFLTEEGVEVTSEPFTLDLSGGDIENLELPLPSSGIAGTVYFDRQNDGQRNVGDILIHGWIVYLDENANGQFDQLTESHTTTNSLGFFLLQAPPGTYAVRVVAPAGFALALPIEAAYTVVLAEGGFVPDKDFSIVLEPNLLEIGTGLSRRDVCWPARLGPSFRLETRTDLTPGAGTWASASSPVLVGDKYCVPNLLPDTSNPNTTRASVFFHLVVDLPGTVITE